MTAKELQITKLEIFRSGKYFLHADVENKGFWELVHTLE